MIRLIEHLSKCFLYSLFQRNLQISWWPFFHRSNIFYLLMKNGIILKMETFGFQKNYTRYDRNIITKIVHLKKIYKFTSEKVFIRHAVFVLIVEYVIKNGKFYFAPNLCKILFFHVSWIFLFIHQKRFYENQKFNFSAKIYEIQICSEKDSLQLNHFQFSKMNKLLLNSAICL